MPTQLNTGVSITLSAAGKRTAYLGPNIPGIIWTVGQVSCFTSSNVTGHNAPRFWLDVSGGAFPFWIGVQ